MYERLLRGPRSAARDAAEAVGVSSVAAPPPASEREKAVIALRRRETGRSERATVAPVASVHPATQGMRAREPANVTRRRREETVIPRRVPLVPKPEVMPVVSRRRVREEDLIATPGHTRRTMIREETPVVAANASRDVALVKGSTRAGRSEARDDQNRHSRSRSREEPATVPSSAELESAFQLVEQYLPRLMPLMRGRGRGRPAGSRGGRGTRGGRGRATATRRGDADEDENY